jgi:twitching motility protein PilI
MSAAVANESPFLLLRDIEARSRTRAMGLPQQVEARRTWSGIGFRVGDLLLVSSLGEINEMLVMPRMTRVPNAKPWVKGVANIRGMLMPILDLRGFVEGVLAEQDRRTRVLLINYDNLAAGLVVDEAMGLRHFFDEERVGGVSDLPEPYREFVVGGYKQGNTHWGVFSVPKLAKCKRFLEVAARM